MLSLVILEVIGACKIYDYDPTPTRAERKSSRAQNKKRLEGEELVNQVGLKRIEFIPEITEGVCLGSKLYFHLDYELKDGTKLSSKYRGKTYYPEYRIKIKSDQGGAYGFSMHLSDDLEVFESQIIVLRMKSSRLGFKQNDTLYLEPDYSSGKLRFNISEEKSK